MTQWLTFSNVLRTRPEYAPAWYVCMVVMAVVPCAFSQEITVQSFKVDNV